MMKPQDDWPEEMTHLRVPSPSAQFSARIIMAAIEAPQTNFFHDLQGLWKWFLHPKPVVGVALTLVVGMFLGWQVSGQGFPTSVVSVQNSAQNSVQNSVQNIASDTALETFYFPDSNL